MASTIDLQLNSSAVNEHTHQTQRADDIQLAADTCATTRTGDWVDVGEGRNLVLSLVVSAKGGSPTFDVTIETSADKGVTDAARTIASFAQQTDNGTTRKCFAGTDRYVRAVITVGGSNPTALVTVAGKVSCCD